MSQAIAATNCSQRELLLALWAAGLCAADICGKYDAFLPAPPSGRTIVIGAGKGAAAMAREFDAIWQGPLHGLVVTRHGYGLPDYAGRIEVIEAGHPVPDRASVEAARRMVELVSGLHADDLVIALISGGASALLVGLPEGVQLEDKQALTRQLLACGAPISDINVVRKAISTIKGGKLARLAAPARVVTFAVSDIPGDDIGAVGSGPTIEEDASPNEALNILHRYAIAIPPAIERYLLATRPPDSVPARSSVEGDGHLVVTPAGSLAAAAREAESAGYEAIVLGDALEGEARELGAAHARLALDLQQRHKRACLISGGETTVTLQGKGRGGRNTEYLLGLALALQGQEGITALAGDTDGIDGSEDNAGAMVFPSSLARARQLGVDARQSLDNNDTYSFFKALDDLLVTGPTYTNVNDLRIILVDQPIAL